MCYKWSCSKLFRHIPVNMQPKTVVSKTFTWRFWHSFFSIRVFFHGHWRLTGQQGKGGDHRHSTIPLPPAHEHLDIYFATLHVRWLSHISNRTACIYQAATRWDLPPYRITIWLIDDVMLILFVYVLIWFKVSVTAIWHWKPVDSNILWDWPLRS